LLSMMKNGWLMMQRAEGCRIKSSLQAGSLRATYQTLV